MFHTVIDSLDGVKLVKRPDTAHYHLSWYCPRTRRTRRTTTGTGDIEEARKRLITAVAHRHRPTSASPHGPLLAGSSEAGTPPLLDLISIYVERTTQCSSRSHPNRGALAQWTRFCEQDNLVYASELTIDAQERFVSWRKETLRNCRNGGSNGTINRELAVARAALRDAWKRGKLASAPYVLSLPSPPPRDRFLTADEARSLLAACQEAHLRRYVMLALHTLQRPSAILQLRTDKVDLQRGRIDFAPKDHIQTRKRKPVLPISASLRDELARAIQESASGYVVEYLGTPVLSVKKSFAAACRRAGLQGVSPYTLRHTGATLLAAAGVPMRQISGMLGHSTMRTTEIYAKHSPDFLTDAAHALSTILAA